MEEVPVTAFEKVVWIGSLIGWTVFSVIALLLGTPWLVVVYRVIFSAGCIAAFLFVHNWVASK
jgi:hypothetical protein